MPVLSRPSPTLVRRLCLSSVIVNCGIVVTGGAVRLTGSGLQCPTWPRCTDDSYVPTEEVPGHLPIEFGNRMLTFVVGLVALATAIAVLRQRPRRAALGWLSAAVLAGVPAQAVIGGITVLSGLNPWTVAGHFLVSMVLIALAMLLWQRSREADGPARPLVRPELVLLGRLVVGVCALVLVLGTLVTGSGPHAGDEAAARTGFDPATVTQVHADAVMLLVGLSVALWLALRATGAPATTRGAVAVLFGCELAQGAVGYTQYFTDLPVLLVGAHLLGACLVWVAALRVLLTMRTRDGAGAGVSGPGGRAHSDAATEPTAQVVVPA